MKPAKILDYKNLWISCTQPDDFKIECNKCHSNDVHITIIDFDKILFYCNSCKHSEK